MNLILVSPHGRSGSLFMQSLFDQHSEVFSLPTFFYYPKWKYHNSTIDCINNFIRIYPDIFNLSEGFLGVVGKNVTSLFGKNGNENITVSKNKFISNAKNIFKDQLKSGISRKNFIEGIHSAYLQTLGYESKKIKFILLHLHKYEDNAHYLALEDYPNLKYIAMIRDPREDWLSWKKVIYIRYPFSKILPYRYNLYTNIKRYKYDIYNLLKFSRKINFNQVKIIDLNRLHILQEEGMRDLCKWLKIDFTEILMKSTFLGKLWHGNAANRKSITGFNSQKAKFNWPQMLSKYEIEFIEIELRKELIKLNYKLTNNKNNQILKNKIPSIFDIFSYHCLMYVYALIDLFSNNKFNNKYTKLFPEFIRKILSILKKSIKIYEILFFTFRDYKSFRKNNLSSFESTEELNATFL